MHIDGARIAVVRVAPDELQQELATVYATRMGDERLEDLELDVRQVDSAVAHGDVALRQVDLEAVDLDDVLFGRL